MKTTRRYAKRMAPAERRDQLLDVALEIIAESGYGAVTMLDVAARADVTRPVVYELFNSRDELLAALLEREERRMQVAVAETLPGLPIGGDADPAEVLAAGMLGFLRAVQAAPGTWRLVYLPEDGTPESLGVRVEQSRRLVHGHLEALLRWALAERGASGGVDVELLAYLAQAFIERAAILVLTRPGEFGPDRLTRFVHQLYEWLGPS